MKFARTITLDESDSRIFEEIASAGEWAISGSFEFSNWKEDEITGKKKQSFSNGWLGLTSFGRATFVGVTSITLEELEKLSTGEIKIKNENKFKEHVATREAIKYCCKKLKVVYGKIIKGDSGKPVLDTIKEGGISISHKFPYAVGMVNLKNKNKIDKLNSGISPIYEPGLDELIKKNFTAKRLSFTTNIYRAINTSDIIFICVGTPTKKGSIKVDLSFVNKCTKEILKYSKRKKIIVTKSTVPVGTGDEIEKIVKKKKKLFTVISNPEFLREGEAIRDFRYPDRIVIGSNEKKTFNIMRKLYTPLTNKGSKFFATSRRGAELIKYASNAFLATKITFINEIADLCEKLGADVHDVAKGIGLDGRIGSKFLHPGPGYGGSCFPKDTLALVQTATKADSSLRIVEAVVEVNDKRKKSMAKKIINACSGNVTDKTLAILGVTFKPNTDDMLSLIHISEPTRRYAIS